MFNPIWLALVPLISVAQVQEPVVRAVRTATPPKIDGRIDDSCWRSCTPATDFYMVEPNPGAPVTQSTFVYVCYDDEKIYFGVDMSEDRPDKIQAAANQRDGTIYLDDSFEIILDTYCDRRNAYYFMSNLISARLDGRIIDEGRNVDQTWDAYWETKAQLVEDGWEMEMAIPFSELSFPHTDSLIWGINFWRVERPHWESTSWARVQRWNQISKYGTLTGISIRPKIKRCDALPYTAVRYERDCWGRDSFNPKAGIDFEYDVTSSLILSATAWPDFAQIEADPFQFNLSYEEAEELRLAEKRPFFLEGGAILATPLQLFYTRRVKEIVAGVKLYGKIGSTELLALDVQTEDTEENFSVIRLKQEFHGTATLGAILTNKQHSPNSTQAAGIDLSLPVWGPFLLTSQVAATGDGGASGKHDLWAAHIGIQGQTGNYEAGLVARRIGPDFWVDQGFINTYDIGREGISGHVSNKFIQDQGWFQWIEGGASFDVQREIGGQLAVGESEFSTSFVTRPKWRFSLSGRRKFQRYSLMDGSMEFVDRGLELELESNVGGMTGMSLVYSFGTMHDIPMKAFAGGFLFLPLARLSVFPVIQGIQWQEKQWEWLTNTRISYQITEKAFFRVFLQAESGYGYPTDQTVELAEIEDLSNNLLFGYEFEPGTIVYIVYNLQRPFGGEYTDHIVVAKITYSLQF